MTGEISARPMSKGKNSSTMDRNTIDGVDWVAPVAPNSNLHLSPFPAGGMDEMAVVRRTWLELTPLQLNPRHLERNRIVTAMPFDPRQAPIDILRTRVSMMMRKNNWDTLAITSPTAGCGKSTLALDLAFSMAKQADFRVALLDFDLRRPAVARLLGLKQSYSIEKLLRGQSTLEESLLAHGTSLAIAPNSKPVAHAAELLRDQSTGMIDCRAETSSQA